MGTILDPNPYGYPAILLLHGLGADKHSWLYQIDVLADVNLRPIAMDIPGFGESDYPASPWTVKSAASKILLQITQIAEPPFHMIGLSMGGSICIHILLEYPEIVRSAILVNSFPCLLGLGGDVSLYFMKRFITLIFSGKKRQAELVANRIFPHPHQAMLRMQASGKISAVNPKIYRQAMLELVRINFSPRLHEIKCPTMIISGEQDTTIPIQSQSELAGKIPNCQHVKISHSGHATPIDKPEKFNHSMLEFLLDTNS